MSYKVYLGLLRKRLVEGGPGSGHFGHAGRPGERGGSLPSDEEYPESFEDKILKSPGLPRGSKFLDAEVVPGLPKASSDPKTGFGKCTEIALSSWREKKLSVFVGYAIPKDRFEEGRRLWDKGVTWYATEAIPHAWNMTADGKIYDATFGSKLAGQYVYVGVRVPDEDLVGMKDGGELASWDTRNLNAEGSK